MLGAPSADAAAPVAHSGAQLLLGQHTPLTLYVAFAYWPMFDTADGSAYMLMLLLALAVCTVCRGPQ
jgi:hypothetical protein